MCTCEILNWTLWDSDTLGTFNGAAAGQAHGPTHMFTGGQSNTPDLVGKLNDLGYNADDEWNNQVGGSK